MASKKELKKATAFLSMISVPSVLKDKISIATNPENGAVTITNKITGQETVIDKQNVVSALKRRDVCNAADVPAKRKGRNKP
jgi:hypothetical protein